MSCRQSWFAFISAAALALCACSQGSNPPGDGGNPDGGGGPTITQAENAVANALCQQYATCFPFLLSLAWGDLATCTQRYQTALAADVAANGYGATPSQFESCASALAGESCTTVRNGVLPTACQVAGSVAAGSPCGTNGQCQTNYCKLGSSGTCGVCAAIEAAGASCTADGDCGPGNICANQTCAAPGTAGATCNATQRCQPSLACNTTTGVCEAYVTTPGGSCAGGHSCDGTLGLFCSPSMICAQATLAPYGGACGFVASSFALCADGGSCITGGALSGTCATPLADGQGCNGDAGTPSCLLPATCTNGTCALPDPAGCH